MIKLLINRKNQKVGTIIEQWLFIVMSLALVVTIIGVVCVESRFVRLYNYYLVQKYVDDMAGDIESDFSINLQMFVERLVDAASENDLAVDDDEYLKRIVNYNHNTMSEVNVVDNNGIIVHSSNPDNIGYDMGSDERSAQFLELLNGSRYLEQTDMVKSYDGKSMIKYAGMPFLDRKGFFQVGIGEDKLSFRKLDDITVKARNRRIGLDGIFIICDRQMNVIGSTDDRLEGKSFENKNILPGQEGEYIKTTADIDGKRCYIVSLLNREYYITGAIPVKEARMTGVFNAIFNGLVFFVVLIVIFLCLSKLLKDHVVKDIVKINGSLSRITGGDLSERVAAYDSLEFCELSEGINKTVDKLEMMIREADERVKQELEFAKVIQTSAVPNAFPPFPGQESFGLFASMDTAKAVGGDFYDFFMTDDNTLVIVIADVSDKGMPAALFMMKAKTLIQTYAEAGLDVEKVAENANLKLCEENDAGMFVTAWIGFMSIDTGVISFVHAGHTKPVIIGKDGAQFLDKKKNFLLGGRKNAQYVRQEFTLSEGDALYLYTDGVTEARNAEGDLYGDDRLLNLLGDKTKTLDASDRNRYAESVCRLVSDDVRAFTDGAEKSDDITMLCLYRRNKG